MDNNERKEVFDRLAAMLIQSGLGWIVEQVTEQIHTGKTEFVEVETLKRSEDTDVVSYDPGRPTSGLRRGPKARFPTTVDYDDKEKLRLLLEGIVQATNVLEMESNAFEQIKAVEPGVGSEITFYSESSGTTATVMSPARVAARDQIVKDCLDATNKLRDESNKD